MVKDQEKHQEKHTLEYYIPEDMLNCQCLYIGLGSLAGDTGCSGRTHLLEHLLVLFDKERTEVERRRYVVEAHTTFHYMYFVVYYHRRLVSDAEVYGILKDIRAGRTIRMSWLESCKQDVIYEIRQYRADREKTFMRICENTGSDMPDDEAAFSERQNYVEYLPIGKEADVASLTPWDMKRFFREQYLHAEAHIVYIRNGRYRYHMAEDQKAARYVLNMHTVFEELFYDVIFFLCVFGMGLSLEEFHMTQLDGKLYLTLADEKLSAVRDALSDKELFYQSLRIVRKRYQKAQEFHMEEQLRLVGECLYHHERILRLSDVKRVRYGGNRKWLYERYMEYLECCVIVIGESI